jgi:hypothetical protein
MRLTKAMKNQGDLLSGPETSVGEFTPFGFQKVHVAI